MFPSVNQHIRLTSFEEKEEAKQYKTTVADLSNDMIMITYPIDEQTGRTAILLDRQAVYVSYMNQDGNQYEFSSEVVRRTKDNIPLLLLRKPELKDIRKIQRRNYLRVPVMLNVDFMIENTKHSARSVDISGGGLLLLCKPEITFPEEAFSVTIHLPDQDIAAKVELVRQPIPQDNGLLKVPLRFTQIAEGHRDKIVRFCFAKQLENRKRSTM
ncbi:flagellar brake protein [Aneurinibacillus uraniidurans]|uniref:flagellar brake protein n=1 Tax=Aneurinibacillus uraniidurans TaxID=2966586 RepID=UPI00234AFF88|nr:flagellar brake domain-containing protein [Aneurinibacillus sp. B1]WCN37220.1 flagellar brake domain-containing protein [Aneurinibacillus sp. B1]